MIISAFTLLPSHSVPVPGANPAVWMSAFCGGLDQQNTAASALEQSPQSQPTAQDLRNQLLHYLDTVQQNPPPPQTTSPSSGRRESPAAHRSSTSRWHSFTSTAKTFSDHRAQPAALDPNDPDLAQKASQLLPNPANFSMTNTQLDQVTDNQKLIHTFLTAPAPDHSANAKVDTRGNDEYGAQAAASAGPQAEGGGGCAHERSPARERSQGVGLQVSFRSGLWARYRRRLSAYLRFS